MKRILKFVAAILALVGVVMMFFTQVTVKMIASGAKENIGISAIAGNGTYKIFGTDYTSVATGLAGYIMLGVGALVILVVALVPVFKNHGILSAVVTGFAVIILIIATFFMFFLRKNFMNENGLLSEQVIVGWGAIAAGSLGSLAAATGALSVVLDIAED